MDNFWISKHGAYSSIKNESRKNIVHPEIAKLISGSSGKKILDYGCGDGSLIHLLSTENEISLFDINAEILSRAGKTNIDHKPILYYQQENIPEDYFDCVVCCLVLMTQPTENDVKTMLAKISSALKENGTAVIAITHPCFRQQVFSSFKTAYSRGKTFNYFEEADAFEVIMHDNETDESVSFEDYHYSLGAIFNLMISSGLTVNKIIELPDKPGSNGQFNSCLSPYLILKGIKQRH